MLDFVIRFRYFLRKTAPVRYWTTAVVFLLTCMRREFRQSVWYLRRCMPAVNLTILRIRQAEDCMVSVRLLSTLCPRIWILKSAGTDRFTMIDTSGEFPQRSLSMDCFLCWEKQGRQGQRSISCPIRKFLRRRDFQQRKSKAGCMRRHT